ncbi:hypothetical protein QQS21_012129 [Conoideocrella luteorostrata]|uniref:protein-ribulosamine 3-kinase n=1 Tax=Conoideocrella luteorostrata TaxID=1105319 RepID=A0AAJ0CC41_9HYPO|nr:hypothetical protein QQS21_012129 [Conoideocrella luteorostrata]
MTHIYNVNPSLIPRPIACGTYEALPDAHFFLCEFRHITNELPSIEAFLEQITELHRNSASPNGCFGFDVATCHGNIPIDHGWSATWEEYFTRSTRALFDLEQQVHGPSEELVRLSKSFFDKVIPRLLRPLETGGRSIKACLIHGDLWHGNASMDGDSQKPIIFDAASFYAHNEYELGVWRQPWNNINASYRDSYYRYFPKSQPEEDYDDRNALYATRVNILDSILYRGKDNSYRQMLIDSMSELVGKFPRGYEGQ